MKNVITNYSVNPLINFVMFVYINQLHTWTRWNSVDGYASACCNLDLWPLIPKANQHIYEPKYICNPYWVKFTSLVCEIWCSQDYWVIACYDLDIWHFDLIGMSKDQVHTSPNFGEICWNIYEDILFTQFVGSLPAVTLTWPLTFRPQNLIGISTNASTSVSRIG